MSTTLQTGTKNSPSFLLACLCVHWQFLSLCLLVLPFDLPHLSPLVSPLFYGAQSMKFLELYSHNTEHDLIWQQTLWGEYFILHCESAPLMNPALGQIWWAPHPPSGTVCHCSLWSSRVWNALSRDMCSLLGWSFSSPDCAPIC